MESKYQFLVLCGQLYLIRIVFWALDIHTDRWITLLMRQSEKNRSRQEIMRDILATIENSPMSKTKVMYRASLSYTQLKYYEDYLQDSKLMELAKEGDLWTLTEKGKRYLNACKLADQILRMPSPHDDTSSSSSDEDLVTAKAESRLIRQ